jgi:hypothetical protein
MADELSRFAARLVRFDPAALIRLKDGSAWGLLPWNVLVRIACPATGDRVVAAASLEPRPDTAWRTALPPSTGRVVETIPAGVVKSAAEAAADTLRQAVATKRAVGERRLRDALLDHVVISGTADSDGTEFAVSQRLVQAIVRMALVEGDNVDVLVAGAWTGLGASLGSAWHRTSSPLTVRPLR